MSQIVAFALRQRVLIVLLLVFMLGAGLLSFARLDIEAYPDPSRSSRSTQGNRRRRPSATSRSRSRSS
jgi:Cu/Ag efflux pump CusA